MNAPLARIGRAHSRALQLPIWRRLGATLAQALGTVTALGSVLWRLAVLVLVLLVSCVLACAVALVPVTLVSLAVVGMVLFHLK
jgi:hypothetical protein